MAALQLVAGSFLIIAGLCVIAWVTRYSPERSARKEIEGLDQMIAHLEDQLGKISTGEEPPSYKGEGKSLEAEIGIRKRRKALLQQCVVPEGLWRKR